MKQSFNKTYGLGSLVIFLPMLVGILIYDDLPFRLPTHWNFSGEADGSSDRFFVVYVIPFLLWLVHLFLNRMVARDSAYTTVPTVLRQIIYWLIPAISLLVSFLSYCVGIGMAVNVNQMLWVFLGLLFLVLGSQLPRCPPNRYVGYRISSTLNNKENWRRTHHLAGICWCIAGVLMILAGFLDMSELSLAIVLVTGMIPAIYSFILNKKGI